MRRSRGFTLVEVMVALAIMALALTWILSRSMRIVREVEASRMRGVAVELARSALWEVEEKLRKDGFQETDQSTDWEPFDEEGWPQISWKADVRKVELPSPEQLQAMAAAQAQAAQEAEAAARAGATAGTGAGTGTGTAAAEATSSGGGLFGMLSMFGGGFTAEDVAGGNFLGGGGYQIVQDVFKNAIRKVVVTVKWSTLGEEESFDVVYYVTDPDAMNKVLGGIAGAGAGDYGEVDGKAVPPTSQNPPGKDPQTPGGGGKIR
jgi:general secretion pathway protein I